MRHDPNFVYFVIDGEEDVFSCAVCDFEIDTEVEEPHSPHQPGCVSRKDDERACGCSTIVCESCCWDCNEIDLHGNVIEPSLAPVLVALGLLDDSMHLRNRHLTVDLGEIRDVPDWEHWLLVGQALEQNERRIEETFLDLLESFLRKAGHGAERTEDNMFKLHPRTLVRLLSRSWQDEGET